jgi:hypothetical protein
MPQSNLAPKEVISLLSKQPPSVVDPTKIATPWLVSSEAALYVKRSVGTLAQMRFHGYGPKFYSDGGKTVYLQSDLDDWLKSGNKRRLGTRGRGKGRGRPPKNSAKKSNARKAAVRG